MENYDFSGWATKCNIKCSDGRTIMKDAFKHNDGKKVPLVWNHQHDDPIDVLGHALLENREEGVYAYCKFNDTESGQTAKELVKHGDVEALSIYANQLKEKMSNVIHGNIREVSLVLAGANIGACIDNVIMHGEESEEEAYIYTGEDITLSHSEEEGSEEDETLAHNNEPEKEEKEPVAEENKKKLSDVYNKLDEEQKTLVHAFLAQALENLGANDEEDEEIEHSEEGDDETMKHNVFDQEDQKNQNVLSHDAMTAIIADAKRYGSMKESFLAHADGDVVEATGTQTYGFNDPDFLFPEARALNNTPEFIKRDTGWVAKVMGGTHHTPFSRIKSVFADITEDDARAKGYIKGKLKKEEVFSLLKRTTTPTTIYKKQKMDRDDIVDITDFDVVAWLKSEMRMMLDEEIARAILVGDGRLASSDDKINESNIRPIWTDADLFTVKAAVNVEASATDEDKAKAFIKTAIKSRKDYKGSGTPTLFTTEDVVTDCLLIEDGMGRRIYNSVTDLATALRVKEIVTVEVMEGLTRTVDSSTHGLMGSIVNLADFIVGADKGGAVNMFDDFDIDYNQQKYLIETRCSGALIKPYSAIAIETVTAAGLCKRLQFKME